MWCKPQNPIFRVGRKGRWKSFFFFPYFFPFQPRREPKWRLEMAVARCPEKSCPQSLVQSSSFFLLSPCQGGGQGACISLCVIPSALSVTRQGPATIPPPPPGAPAGILLQFSLRTCWALDWAVTMMISIPSLQIRKLRPATPFLLSFLLN